MTPTVKAMKAVASKVLGKKAILVRRCGCITSYNRRVEKPACGSIGCTSEQCKRKTDILIGCINHDYTGSLSRVVKWSVNGHEAMIGLGEPVRYYESEDEDYYVSSGEIQCSCSSCDSFGDEEDYNGVLEDSYQDDDDEW